MNPTIGMLESTIPLAEFADAVIIFATLMIAFGILGVVVLGLQFLCIVLIQREQSSRENQRLVTAAIEYHSRG